MHGVGYGYVPTYLLDAIPPASAVGGQYPTGVIVGRFQSFLRFWSASLESAAHISDAAHTNWTVSQRLSVTAKLSSLQRHTVHLNNC